VQTWYRSIHFPLNGQTGWAAGGAGVLVKTTNGGQSWFQQNPGINYFLYQVQFPVDEQTGYLCGFFGSLFRTTNGGGNWEVYYAPTNNVLYAMDFPVGRWVGWIGGVGGAILRTNTGGTSGVEEGGEVAVMRTEAPPSIMCSSVLHVARRSALVDISGRRVMDLEPGENDIRRVSPGVYFLRQDSRGPRVEVSNTKVVIER
jgi:hypothetical protein